MFLYTDPKIDPKTDPNDYFDYTIQCQPELQSVSLPPPHNSKVVYIPSSVWIMQCCGICPTNREECNPTESTDISVPVS